MLQLLLLGYNFEESRYISEGESICPRLAYRGNSPESGLGQEGSLVFISLSLIRHLINGGKQKMHELWSFKRHVCLVVSRDF